MSFYALFLIALSLSFDTFAVSVGAGLCKKDIRFFPAARIAFVLAVFQGGMPFIGWWGGSQLAYLIGDYDHWVSLFLFSIIGVKMISEAFKDPEEKSFNPQQTTVVLGIAIATSIDALVVGVSMAFFDVNIYQAVLVIGAVTFVASMAGMLLGKKVNGRFGRKVEVFGGIILIAIGIKIACSHLIA
ncbi:MAG: manganese efflux pump MntP family protein [Paludibacter sp.]|nr:manganese efflux pump MntP family protein [Paludibacter sp.]